MSEQAPKDQRPEQPEDAGGNGNAEDDLDALLAQASSLASELSDETGTPSTLERDPAVENAETDPTTEHVAESEPVFEETSDQASESAPEPVLDPAGHVETQLAELEELAHAVGEELGASSDEEHDASHEAPNDEANENEARNVTADAAPDEAASEPAPAPDTPDFMADFTDAEIPSLDDPDAEGTPSPPNQLAPASSRTLSATDTEAVGIVSNRNPSPTPGAESASPAIPTAGDGISGDAQSGADRGRGSIISSAAVLGAGSLGATLLELADRPFGRLGHKVRGLIGWVAIATVATSLVVFAVSLF